MLRMILVLFSTLCASSSINAETLSYVCSIKKNGFTLKLTINVDTNLLFAKVITEANSSFKVITEYKDGVVGVASTHPLPGLPPPPIMKQFVRINPSAIDFGGEVANKEIERIAINRRTDVVIMKEGTTGPCVPLQ